MLWFGNVHKLGGRWYQKIPFAHSMPQIEDYVSALHWQEEQQLSMNSSHHWSQTDIVVKATTLSTPCRPSKLPPNSGNSTKQWTNSLPKPHLANDSLICPKCMLGMNITIVLVELNQEPRVGHFPIEITWLEKEPIPIFTWRIHQHDFQHVLIQVNEIYGKNVVGQDISVPYFRWIITTQSMALSNSQGQDQQGDNLKDEKLQCTESSTTWSPNSQPFLGFQWFQGRLF